jgi:hypothetical protein
MSTTIGTIGNVNVGAVVGGGVRIDAVVTL